MYRFIIPVINKTGEKLYLFTTAKNLVQAQRYACNLLKAMGRNPFHYHQFHTTKKSLIA